MRSAALFGVPVVLVAAVTATTAGGAMSRVAQRSVSLVAAPKIVRFGSPVTLAGVVSPARENRKVNIEARACGSASSAPVVGVKTGPNGTYSAGQSPVQNTVYQAQWHRWTSALVPVLVRPRVKLAKVERHKFQIRVMAVRSLAGHRVLFEWHTSHGWSTLRKLRLTYWGQVISTSVSGKIFKSKIQKGKRVRVLLTPKQAAPCYVSGHSAIIRS